MAQKFGTFLALLLIALQATIFFAVDMGTGARIFALVLVSLAIVISVCGRFFKKAVVRSLAETMIEKEAGQSFDVDAAFERAMRRRGMLPKDDDAPHD